MFSSIPAYVTSIPLVFTGIFSLYWPLARYGLYGLASPTVQSSGRKASPFVYATGIRDIALGVTTLALHLKGNEDGVTILLVAAAITGLCDGCVVWFNGGKVLRGKAWGHWIGSTVLLVPFIAARVLSHAN